MGPWLYFTLGWKSSLKLKFSRLITDEIQQIFPLETIPDVLK